MSKTCCTSAASTSATKRFDIGGTASAQCSLIRFEIGELIQGCCQTNANSSLCGMNVVILCSTKLTPLGESSVALKFEIISRCKMALVIEVIVDCRVG